MSQHEGGCLCGAVRFVATAEPTRVTICHCRFCQRNTGTAFMVEPIFPKAAFDVIAGSPATFDVTSAGSGKGVSIHFCGKCGSRLFLSFERFADVVGAFAGAFDDPNWCAPTATNSRHIFTAVAQHGTVLPAGIPIFLEHATRTDGTANQPTVLTAPRTVGA